MKIKRFDNLWTMGLIIFGALLIIFYLLKIACPSFIIGVAEIPKIVEIGTYIDTHLWAYYLFSFVISFATGILYISACCRKTKLNWKQYVIFASSVIGLLLIQALLPTIYVASNYVFFVLMPFLLNFLDKNLSKETFISTVVCFSVDIMAQALSMQIRDIVKMATCINSATVTILLIDMVIWRVLLYLFFNFKKGEN